MEMTYNYTYTLSCERTYQSKDYYHEDKAKDRKSKC